MVQILESPKSFGSQLVSGLAQAAPGIGDALEKLAMKKQEDEYLKKHGMEDLIGAPKDFRQLMLQQKALEQQEKFKSEQREKERSKLFGQNGLNLETYKKMSPEQRGLVHTHFKEEAKQFDKELKRQEELEKPNKKTQASQPIDPEQLENIKKVRNIPGYNELDEFEKYKLLTENNVSKENAETESKLSANVLDRKSKEFIKAYEKQEDFIKNTTSSYRAFETDTKPKLLQMQKIASDNELIGPSEAVFLEYMGIPLGALEHPHSELFNKLSLDLLKGLPDVYGNRILKVEVENFLQTIPSLINSPNGRRMIASNMLKLGEMKEIFYNEMRHQQKQYIDENKPLPPDFEQRIFDQVRPQIDRVNSEFAKMATVTSVPEGTIPVFTPYGDIKYIPSQDIDRVVKAGAKRIW